MNTRLFKMLRDSICEAGRMRDKEFYQKNGYVTALVNNVFSVKGLSYLELGLHTGVNHEHIICRDKVSVDANPDTNPTHCMTTDEFFKQNMRTFDLVFIDASHEYHQVVTDFNNAVKITRIGVILHDMYPPAKELTTSDKCGDAYKLLYHLVKNTALLPLTLDTDCGLTVVPMPAFEVEPPAELDSLSYEDFVYAMKEYHRYDLPSFLEVTRRFL